MNQPTFSLAELQTRFRLSLRGDPDVRIDGIGTLTSAGPTQIAFLAGRAHRKALPATRAGVVVLRETDANACPTAALISSDPYLDFARIASLFDRRIHPAAGIHGSAVVDASADIDPSASIGPFCAVGPRARIEAGVELGPGCAVGQDCVVGAQSRLVARVTLVERVRLGRRVLVHPGAVIGADGFGLVPTPDGWFKLPQLGGVWIGDDCEIGANTTIDRGAIEDTVLDEDVRLDNQIHIAHNVRIGAHTAMAGCAAIAGSTQIGRWCLIGGAVGIVGHIEICDHVTIIAMSRVTQSIRQPGEYGSGTPLQPSRLWRRNAVRFTQLDAMAKRLGKSPQEPLDE